MFMSYTRIDITAKALYYTTSQYSCEGKCHGYLLKETINMKSSDYPNLKTSIKISSLIKKIVRS
jgi:hypothetical protein